MIHIIYHKGCPDGFGAAYAAWRKLHGKSVTYHAYQHGDPIPQGIDKGDDVYMLDMCMSKDDNIAIADRCNVLVILDHHKSAMLAMRNVYHPNIIQRFNMDKSGAVLSWEHFHAGAPVPDMLRHIQDRDLWQWKLDGSKEVLAWMDTFDFDFDSWLSLDRLVAKDPGAVRRNGALISVYKERCVDIIAKRVQWMDIEGYRVPVVNTSIHYSEVGASLNKAYPEAPFSAYYFDNDDGTRVWGLRSQGSFDVSEIAVRFGGGGHRNAAGFRQKHLVPVPRVI